MATKAQPAPEAPKALSTSITLNQTVPCKGSVRVKGARTGDPIVSDLYLNRTRLAFMGIPEGHVPTKVEVVVRILETAPEASLAAPATESK